MLLPPLGQLLLGADDGHVGDQHLWRLEDGDEVKVLVLGPGATESGLLVEGWESLGSSSCTASCSQ